MTEEIKPERESDVNFDFESLKFYLPPSISGDAPYLKNMLFKYLETEFPRKSRTAVYHIPKEYSREGQKQGCLAEEMVFKRLRDLTTLEINNLWIIFFHSACYGGYSNRNQRLGKLMIRENDFVIFVKNKEKNFVLLVEVKSTHDKATIKTNLEVIADSKSIKNNKRSAQHQLRDHLEILENGLGYDISRETQCYIMWPFLGQYTKDPTQKIIKRWSEDKNLHVFEDTISSQESFNVWFADEVLTQESCSERTFAHLLTRYIVLSCGIFMDEIHRDLLALLTQEQLSVLTSSTCKKGGALVVHGTAGTGKSLLILKKLQVLHENGQLDENNRALYICYWPGIRCEVQQRLKIMGIENFVDTTRFYITSSHFMKNNWRKYKHVFMDEAEAIILSFQAEIVQDTFYRIYKAYHDGNCHRENCSLADLEAFKQHSILKLIKFHIEDKISWGELWFMVDTDQALMFLPKHSPVILKTPNLVLNKLIRSTKPICRFFSAITNKAMPQEHLSFPKAEKEPPIFWVQRKASIAQSISEVIVDLCSTKGIRPCDICVIPFLQNEKISAEAINAQICLKFVDKAFRPEGVNDVEQFLTHKKPNQFLVAWALRVKGLEFKVVIMVFDEEQFDSADPDDRRKVYIICSRCTCMLLVVGDSDVRNVLGLNKLSEDYCFNIKFEYDNNDK